MIGRMVSTPSLLQDVDRYLHASSSTPIQSCTCEKRTSTDYFGFIHRSTRSQGPGCFVHGPSGQVSSVIGAKILLSRLISRGVELTFSYTYGTGGFSISSRLSPINIVDKSSPGFGSIRHAKKNLVRLTGFHPSLDISCWNGNATEETLLEIDLILADLHTELYRCLSDRTASGHDQYANGYTLLHVSQLSTYGRSSGIGIVRILLNDSKPSLRSLNTDWCR
jgi:hypothetical protein